RRLPMKFAARTLHQPLLTYNFRFLSTESTLACADLWVSLLFAMLLLVPNVFRIAEVKRRLPMKFAARTLHQPLLTYNFRFLTTKSTRACADLCVSLFFVVLLLVPNRFRIAEVKRRLPFVNQKFAVCVMHQPLLTYNFRFLTTKSTLACADLCVSLLFVMLLLVPNVFRIAEVKRRVPMKFAARTLRQPLLTYNFRFLTTKSTLACADLCVSLFFVVLLLVPNVFRIAEVKRRLPMKFAARTLHQPLLTYNFRFLTTKSTLACADLCVSLFFVMLLLVPNVFRIAEVKRRLSMKFAARTLHQPLLTYNSGFLTTKSTLACADLCVSLFFVML